jgi:outer membrane immunogenic protein
MAGRRGEIVFSLAVAAGLALPSPVPAADLPRAAPAYKAAPVPAAANWTGFYAGLNAGYGWGAGTSSLEYLFLGVPTPISLGVPGSYRNQSSGFIGGGQVGYNFQLDRMVFGIEADLSYSDIHSNDPVDGTTAGGTPFTSTQAQRVKWLGTVRGRIGYAPNDMLLLYATGGSAFGRVEDSSLLSFHQVGGTTYFGSSTSTRSGWTVGGGAEYRIGANLSAKAEYLYFDLGSTSVLGIDVTSPGNPFQTHAVFGHNGHIVRAGLNYQFAGP